MSDFRFEEQIRYFEKKLNIKTHTYLDVMGAEHNYLFMVAGANRNEVLVALREAVDEAIHQGGTLEQFRKRFDEIVANTGWDYQGGRNWRTRVIYDTNVYGAYNRGRLHQHLALKDELPFWEYVHHDNAHPREEHMEWDGLVLRADDPWWRYHYPIKAYGCHCTVEAHDEDDLQTLGKQVSDAPEIEFEDNVVGVRSGNPRQVRVAKGTDVGFEPYDFTRLNHDKLINADTVLMQKLVNAPPHFASLLVDDVLKNQGAMQLLNQSMASMVEQVVSEKMARGQLKYVGVIPQDVIAKLENKALAPSSAVIAVRDDDILHALRDSKQSKQLHLPVSFWQDLPEKLRHPKAILLDSQQKQPTLLFVYETEQGKVAIKLDYKVQLQDAFTQKKQRTKLNMVRTASKVDERQWQSLKSYDVLWGKLD